MELFEDACLLVERDTHAGVGDADLQLVVHLARKDADGASSGEVLGVV